MKKKIFGALVIVAIAVGAMINVNLNKLTNKGDLALANVEALADTEGTTGVYSIMIVDGGIESRCINNSVCKVQKSTVYCFGTGNLNCTPGTLEIITPSDVYCGDV